MRGEEKRSSYPCFADASQRGFASIEVGSLIPRHAILSFTFTIVKSSPDPIVTQTATSRAGAQPR